MPACAARCGGASLLEEEERVCLVGGESVQLSSAWHRAQRHPCGGCGEEEGAAAAATRAGAGAAGAAATVGGTHSGKDKETKKGGEKMKEAEEDESF